MSVNTVSRVERIGSLYTQHFAGGRRFELSYHGELAGVSNTRPLFAALVKGLVSSISDTGGRDVNIVNATLIAKERGIAIDEKHVRDDGAYASAVTLRSLQPGESADRIIEGYVSGKAVFISKLGKFAANFHPEGTLLVLHNYDEPGKIGNVGMVLGRYGINITFMQVAALNREARLAAEAAASSTAGSVADGPVDDGDAAGARGNGNGSGNNQLMKEALMILGVAGDVTKEVVDELQHSEGILDVSLIRL